MAAANKSCRNDCEPAGIDDPWAQTIPFQRKEKGEVAYRRYASKFTDPDSKGCPARWKGT